MRTNEKKEINDRLLRQEAKAEYGDYRRLKTKLVLLPSPRDSIRTVGYSNTLFVIRRIFSVFGYYYSLGPFEYIRLRLFETFDDSNGEFNQYPKLFDRFRVSYLHLNNVLDDSCSFCGP